MKIVWYWWKLQSRWLIEPKIEFVSCLLITVPSSVSVLWAAVNNAASRGRASVLPVNKLHFLFPCLSVSLSLSLALSHTHHTRTHAHTHTWSHDHKASKQTHGHTNVKPATQHQLTNDTSLSAHLASHPPLFQSLSGGDCFEIQGCTANLIGSN